MPGISSYIPDTTNPNNEIFAYQQPKIKQKFCGTLDKK